MVRKGMLLSLLAVFFLGWFSGTVHSGYFEEYKADRDVVLDRGIEEDPEILDSDRYQVEHLLEKEFQRLEELFESEDETKRDKASPHDWISTDQIKVYNDRVVIEVRDPEWAIFTDTKSMDPVIDSASNAIEIIPKSEADIHVGDIVAYKSRYKDGIVTHRVVEIGNDAQGWYARMKGDNNDYIDPGKVRFNQVKRVVAAIIY